MNKKIMKPSILLLLAACTMTAQAEDVRAILKLSSGVKWTGTIQKKNGDMITFLRDGSENPLSLPESNFTSIAFLGLDINFVELVAQYQAGEYQAVLDAMTPVLEPRYTYMNLSNPLRPALVLLMKTYYWNDQSSLALETLNKIETLYGKDASDNAELASYAGLCHLKVNNLKAVEASIKELNITGVHTDSAQNLYLLAAYLQKKGEVEQALKTATHIIAFHARDAQWMGPGLYLTAQLYGQNHKFGAAKSVVKEMKVFCGDNAWGKLADPLSAQLDRDADKYFEKM